MPADVHDSIELSNTQNVASAASIQSSISKSIAQCPTKNYVLISQPGVSTDDFSDPRNTPLLRRRLSTTNAGQSSFIIRDVIDSIDTGSIVESMSNSCVLGARDIDASAGFIPDIDRSKWLENVFNVAFPALNDDLSEAERHIMLLAHDSYVESLIDNYFNNEDYTMIYTTSSVHAAKSSLTASERQVYEMQDAPLRGIMHSGELRRSLSERKDGSSSNQTIVDGPLFDKYQFLSPGKCHTQNLWFS